MNLLVFMPLIILIVLIAVIIYFARKAVFIKKANTALIIYIAILFVCTIVYILMPKSNSNVGSYLGVEQQDAESSRIISALYAGKIDEVEDYVIDEQSFEYDGDELMLEEAQDDASWVEVVIERKEENDGIVEVNQLNTGIYLNNVNVTQKLEPMQIEITEDILSVQNTPSTNNIEMTLYKKDFPILQFTSGKDVSGFFSSADAMGYDVIYLRIPNNVLVKNETSYTVKYVE